MSRIEQIIKQTILSMQEFSKDNDDVEFAIPEISDTIPQYTYSDLLEKNSSYRC